jgi:hypothetical protein
MSEMNMDSEEHAEYHRQLDAMIREILDLRREHAEYDRCLEAALEAHRTEVRQGLKEILAIIESATGELRRPPSLRAVPPPEDPEMK